MPAESERQHNLGLYSLSLSKFWLMLHFTFFGDGQAAANTVVEEQWKTWSSGYNDTGLGVRQLE